MRIIRSSSIWIGLMSAGGAIACACAIAAAAPRVALAQDIPYRSFSSSAAIGPPAEAFAARLSEVTRTTLGTAGEVHLVPLPGLPPIPPQFSGDVVAAVAAGRSGGGFDAAYISGSDLNRAWGFLYNSGVPFGPTFDEFVGFLYGRSIEDGRRTGLDLAQELLDARGRGVVAIPVVGSPEQLSGYFPEPMDDVRGRAGIGLSGLCQEPWTLRYLPPGEGVLGRACDDLVAEGRIAKKRLTFIQAIPGGGSLVQAALAGTIQGFEFATPVDDVSQLFQTADNPGTAGLRYVHTPGWQQQFLITWMVINRQAWGALDARQQLLVRTVAQGSLIASYAENVRQQGAALDVILGANRRDGDPGNDMVLSGWATRDLARLRDATLRFLDDRIVDLALPAPDRADYARILSAIRAYVRANDLYWDRRQVDPSARFRDWADPAGECWETSCDPRRLERGRRH